MENLGDKMKSLNLYPRSLLKDGILIKDLVQNNTAEFTLDVSEQLQKELGESDFDMYIHDDFNLLSSIDNAVKESIENFLTASFLEIREKMTEVSNDGKIKKQILKHGSGEVISIGSTVYYHYSCYLEKQDVPFDSSYLRNKPMRVKLGSGALYPGFEISLLSMKLKEHSIFLVEPQYAFGEMGCPPRIPPNATLLLTIELLRIVEGNEIESLDLPLEEKETFHEVSVKAKNYHMLGNSLFKKGEISASIDKYRKAENLLLSCKMASDEEEAVCRKLLFKIYTNFCVCYNHPNFKWPEKVCLAAKEAFYINPDKAQKSAKLFFHLGKAQLAFEDFDKAKRNLKKAQSLEPNNRDIIDLLAIVEEKKKKSHDHDKISFQKSFQNQKTEPKGDEEPQIQFIAVFKHQLEDLIKGTISELTLPKNLSLKEKQMCQKMSEECGLKYEEIMISGKRSIHITK